MKPVAILLLLIPAAGFQFSSLEAQSPSVLRPGDAIHIAVWHQPELSGEFTIASDSTILHPLYGGIKVAGEPMDVVRGRVLSILTRFETDPQFVIEPRVRVFVGGQVGQPGLYTFPVGTPLVDAVNLAGGVAPLGDRADVRLLREGEETVIDLRNPSLEPARVPVQSGDLVTVDRRRRIFQDYVLPVTSFVGSIFTIILFVDRIQ